MKGREDYPGVWRYIIVIVSMIEVLCFSGIIYGWGALVYVLKDEGFLVELCQTHNRTNSAKDNNLEPLMANISLNVECSARDARFNLYFTLISSIGVLLILIVGHTFTRFGTRITRFIFITCFCIGCLCIAFSDTEYPWLVCVGGILMIGSGYVFIITSTQFNMLFPGHSSTIVGIMNGMKVSSSFMQQLVKIAHDGGINRGIVYIGLFGLTCLTYLTTFYLYPKTILKDKEKRVEKIITVEDGKEKRAEISNRMDNTKLEPNHSTENKIKNSKERSNNNNNHIHCTDFGNKKNVDNGVLKGVGTEIKSKGYIPDIVQNNASLKLCYFNNGFKDEIDKCCPTCKKENDTEACKLGENEKIKSMTNDTNDEPCKDSLSHINEDQTDNKDGIQLKTYMCGYLYIFNVLWFTVIRFRTNYFYGTINPYIEEVTNHDVNKVSYFTDFLSYSMACGIVTCVIVGVLYDWQRRFFVNIEDIKKRRVMSSVCPLITACLVSVLLSGLVFVKEEPVLYPITIIFTFFRSLLTTVGNTFLVDMFPASIYGTIYGTRFVIANIFSLIQYALYQWSLAYPGASVHVNIFVLCLCLTTLIHPVSILLANSRHHTRRVTHL